MPRFLLMTSLKIAVALLLVLFVGSDSAASGSANLRQSPASSQSVAASAENANPGVSATPPFLPAPSRCFEKAATVADDQCLCPSSTAAAPSAVPCATPCVAAPGGGAPSTAVLCPPCPVMTENPSGICPIIPPSPAQQPSPPATSPPVIAFCPTPPVARQIAPGVIQLQGYVCGRGFHASETVTLSATGLGQKVSWQVQASTSGAFVSPLPPALCRLAPVTIVAIGNAGDRSNSLLLSATSCLPTV